MHGELIVATTKTMFGFVFGKCNGSAKDIIVVFISAVDVREKHIRMQKFVHLQSLFCYVQSHT